MCILSNANIKVFIVLAFLVQVGCSRIDLRHYSPMSHQKTREFSVVGSLYDYKYEYFYLKITDDVHVEIDLISSVNKKLTISIKFSVKENSNMQLSNNNIVILSKEFQNEYVSLIKEIIVPFECSDGTFIKKDSLELIKGSNLKACVNKSNEEYLKYVANVITDINMDSAPEKIEIIFPSIYVNGEEKVVQLIVFKLKNIESGLLGIF